MTTSLCKRVVLLVAGVAFLLMGCAATDERNKGLTPVHWTGAGHQGGSEGFFWAGGSVKGQWNGFKIAVLPVHNMTAVPAPVKTMEEIFYTALRRRGVQVLEKETLEEFMAGRRMRYTGGIDRISASAMREELDIEAVFITSLEHFDEGRPPKISLFARLVYLGQNPEIQWMDLYCKAGDDQPGFLDLGVIEDPDELMEEAANELVGSMMLKLTDVNLRISEKAREHERLQPGGNGLADIPSVERPTIAVLPFFNLSERSRAWEILPLHFVEQMVAWPGIRILEPGEVRRALLNYRVFLQGGLSLPHLELVLKSTGADLVLTGTVLRYLDTRSALKDPEVDFSVEMFGRKSKEVVWSSRGDGRGGDGVFFFDVGRKSTACGVANALVIKAVSGMPLQEGGSQTQWKKEGIVP